MAKLLNKKTKKKLEVLFVPPIAYIILQFIYFTCKKRYHFDKAKVNKTPSIFVFWHGELMMLPFGYRDYRKSHNIDTIVSQHHDGELATRLLNMLGGGAIRGSSSKGGLKALKDAFKSLNNGRDVGITPDGPRGPRHSVADGAVVIAQKKDVPIVTMNIKISSCWRLNSWDKFAIPKPFSTLDYYYSDPFYITNLSMDDAKKMVKERLSIHAF